MLKSLREKRVFVWTKCCCDDSKVFRLHIYLYIHYTYLITQWSRVLLEKLAGFQLVKKFPAF